MAHIPNPNEHTLLTSKLFGTNLGAFYVCNTKSNDDELCLSLWRQSGPTSSDTIVTFDSTPLAIVSHNHSKPLSTSPCTSPPPSVMVTCTSGSNHISECLYSYLFSHEDLILKSPVIIYGCICGCVLAVPFKRVQDHQPQVICSFNDHQSVVSIHTCTLGVGPSSIHNSLICIGSNGCVNIFVAHNSTVTHRQVFIAPQLISTILVHGLGLVYSSIDTVQKICMRHQCCSSVASTSTDDAVLRVFNTPLVLIQSPLVILCVDRGIMLGITMDGRLTYQHLHSQQTPCVGMTTNTSAAAVGESMKTSVLSLQTSADILRQLQHDISNIDDSLMALNETILLFRRLRTSDRSPLVLQAEVLYEQNGVDQHSPYLQITVTCIDSRPLRRGVALIIDVGCHDDTRMKVFMERRISKEDELCVFSQTFDLQGFQSGCGQLILKPKIPFHYYHSLRLNISFYCVYNPQNHGSLELELQSNLKNQLGIVKICQQKLSPLHFVSPVKSINNRSSAKTQISLNISLNSLNTVTGCTSTTDDPSKPMDSRLLSGLFTCSKMEEFIVQVYRGGRGLQVRMVCGIDLVMVQLHWNATQNHFVLTFDSSCKELAILLVNEITQRIVTQVRSTENGQGKPMHVPQMFISVSMLSKNDFCFPFIPGQ